MGTSELKRKLLTLAITEACNLDCIYCYQYSKSNQKMSLAIAKQKIEYYINNSDDFDELEIDLFGGEPLLEIDFIIELVEWTKKQNFKKPYIFFAPTNGTMVTESIKEWLVLNSKIFWLGLSIDGLPETHNFNRSNSYSNIDLDFFVKTYPFQAVKMTVSEPTLHHFYDNIVHLHSLGFLVDAAFAQGMNWDFEYSKTTLIRELKKLTEFYINNPNIKPISLLNRPLSPVAIELNKTKDFKTCGCGTNMVSIDINGNEYPCHLFLPSSMPANSWENIDFSNESFFQNIDCANCIIKNICTTCLGMNLRENIQISGKDSIICEFNKILALATSYMFGKKIALGYNLDINNNNLSLTIEAITKIQNEYSNIYTL